MNIYKILEGIYYLKTFRSILAFKVELLFQITISFNEPRKKEGIYSNSKQIGRHLMPVCLLPSGDALYWLVVYFLLTIWFCADDLAQK